MRLVFLIAILGVLFAVGKASYKNAGLSFLQYLRKTMFVPGVIAVLFAFIFSLLMMVSAEPARHLFDFLGVVFVFMLLYGAIDTALYFICREIRKNKGVKDEPEIKSQPETPNPKQIGRAHV